MAYTLDAIIAERALISSLGDGLPDARAVELGGRVVLLPLTANAVEVLSPNRKWGRARWLLNGEAIPIPLVDILCRASAGGNVVYVEAEFFGGDGAQASMVWRDGRLVLGPVIDPPGFPRRDRARDEPRPPLAELPINRALRELGVRRAAAAMDEFETVGLGRHRSTEQWTDAAQCLR